MSLDSPKFIISSRDSYSRRLPAAVGDETPAARQEGQPPLAMAHESQALTEEAAGHRRRARRRRHGIAGSRADSGQTPEQTPGQTAGQTVGQMSGQMPGQALEQAPGQELKFPGQSKSVDQS